MRQPEMCHSRLMNATTKAMIELALKNDQTVSKAVALSIHRRSVVNNSIIKIHLQTNRFY